MTSLILNPLRYLFSASLRTAFQPDVRHNPVVLNADRQSDDGSFRNKEERRGFSPQYVAPLRPPRTSFEAQRLYNHLRTVAWYLDAIPFLGKQLPFNVGVDSIIGLIPGLGDYIGVVLSLYALFLSCLFGLPLEIIGFMLINIVLDCVLGLVPIVGDALDVAFKANLRNLRLLEDHLDRNKGVCGAGRFSLTFPPSNRFLPLESPQAARGAMPSVNESESRGWRRTRNANQTAATSDFGSGAMGSEAPPVAPNGAFTDAQEQEVRNEEGPEYVFSTMRYEQRGARIEDLIPEEVLGKGGRGTSTEGQELGGQIPLLSRHVARIVAARKAMQARYKGWIDMKLGDAELSTALVTALQKRLSSELGLRRVRLALDRRGEIEVTVAPMSATDREAPPAQVRIDTRPIGEEAQRAGVLHYKTSSRQTYDEARERVGATLGMSNVSVVDPCFDVLLCRHGKNGYADSKKLHLTESSIANVIVEVFHPHGFYTPTASQNALLPGLMRGELLERGLIREADLAVDDVVDMIRGNRARLWLCNALRGVFPVQLQFHD